MNCPMVEDFLRFLATEKNASPRTLVNYRKALESFAADFGTSPPPWRDLDPEPFRDWLYRMMKSGLAKATIRLRFAALRSFYRHLLLRHGLARNPLASIQLPKTERKLPVVLNLSQIDELLALPLQLPLPRNTPPWVPLRDAAILELFYSCGLRIAELRDLDVMHFDFLSETLRVLGKGRKERQVPYAGKAAEALEAWLAERHAERGIPAVFVETSVADRNVAALVEGAAARGHRVVLGGRLYSDSLGEPGSGADSLEGALSANVETIVTALAGIGAAAPAPAAGDAPP